MAMPSQRALVLVGLLLAGPAWASKFTGPKSAEVRCRVLRLLAAGEAPPASPRTERRGELRWVLPPGPDEVVAEVELLSVEAYDANGWNSRASDFVPKRLYVVLPRSTPIGQEGRAQLRYAPGYEGKLEISHVRVEARWQP
jgi:hypothetical protein